MTKQHALGRAVAFWRHPLKSITRLVKRKAKRKMRRAKKTTRRPVNIKTYGGVRRGSGGRHDIVPGRTVVEWLGHAELGRGRVLAFLPGRALDVLFEAGGRPPNGVPIEEVRVLA